MRKHSFRERFSYWFDNKMSGGSLGLIKFLAIVTVCVIVLIAVVLFILSGAEDRDIGSSLWDSMATVINAWMPSYEDGGPAYLILMAVSAVVGLFVTSVLIGIVSSAIEEKITSLRKGTSAVLEENHIVVLGFYPGEYTLLRQLVLASSDRNACIVVAEDMEQEEMEQSISNNVKVPKNVRIICRTADISDPQMLSRLAAEEAGSIVISPTEDSRTLKTLLAVSNLIKQEEKSSVRIFAVMSHEEYAFPQSIAEKHNVTALQTYETIAKIIAHSCTQPRLSETFREMLNFEGSEMFIVRIPEASGICFGELSVRMDRGVPLGILRGNNMLLNPGEDFEILRDDRILVFAEDQESSRLLDQTDIPEKQPEIVGFTPDFEEHPGRIVILGCSETIGIVLHELPDNVTDILIAGDCEAHQELIDEELSLRPNLRLLYDDRDYMKTENLLQIVREADHIVILSNHETEDEEADIESISLLLRLRDLRDRNQLSYNITSEMRRENNQALIENDDRTDFVVASNMSSLLLAQLAESPELLGTFKELLSNTGNELYLKEASVFGLQGTHTTAEIRRTTLRYGYLFMGYIKEGAAKSIFNPRLQENISLSAEDELIVIGED